MKYSANRRDDDLMWNDKTFKKCSVLGLHVVETNFHASLVVQFSCRAEERLAYPRLHGRIAKGKEIRADLVCGAELDPRGPDDICRKAEGGESWWALDVALAKAGGRFVLGELHLTEGDVLYAALEDNDRRLRSRIERILTQNALTWPDRLTLATQWRRLDAGGVDDAKEWAASVKEPPCHHF